MSGERLRKAADALDAAEAGLLMFTDETGADISKAGGAGKVLAINLAAWLRVTEQDTGSSSTAYKAAEVVADTILGL